jgi:hypothetical protein
MPRVSPFHSVNEFKKQPGQRAYHDNDVCALGREIPRWEQRDGTGGHRQCKECERLNRSAPNRWV